MTEPMTDERLGGIRENIQDGEYQTFSDLSDRRASPEKATWVPYSDSDREDEP